MENDFDHRQQIPLVRCNAPGLLHRPVSGALSGPQEGLRPLIDTTLFVLRTLLDYLGETGLGG